VGGDGAEIQFEIEGQEALIARRGSIVQATKQTIFSLPENVAEP
jgi:hypothetical protein